MSESIDLDQRAHDAILNLAGSSFTATAIMAKKANLARAARSYALVAGGEVLATYRTWPAAACHLSTVRAIDPAARIAQIEQS